MVCGWMMHDSGSCSSGSGLGVMLCMFGMVLGEWGRIRCIF